MKPSLIVHEMIHSLTEGEKKFFLKASSLQHGDKNYLKLFEFISELDVYDEEEVREKFRKEGFVKHLASEKNQLFHHILKSLRLYRISEKSSAYTFEKVKDVELLFERGLTELALAEANILRKKAVEDELYYSLLELSKVQIRFTPKSTMPGDMHCKRLNDLVAERREYLRQIEVLDIYQQLLNEVQFYFNQNILIHDNSKKYLLERFINHPYLQDLNHATNKKSYLLGTYCRMICYRLLRDHKKLGDELKVATDLFRTYGFLIEEFPKIYISLYGFKARYEAITENLGSAKVLIDHIREVRTHKAFETQDLQNYIFTRLTIYDLMYINFSGQYELADPLIPQIRDALARNQGKYMTHELTAIYFLLFVNYFAKNEITNALKYLNELLNTDFEESRQDLYRLAKLCYLIVHFEMNNESYLIYSFKSTQRFFKKIEHPFLYETTFLKYFRLFAISVKKEEHKLEYLMSLKEKLNDIFKDPYQKIATEYFDLIAWIDSKLNGTSYLEEIKKSRNQ